MLNSRTLAFEKELEATDYRERKLPPGISTYLSPLAVFQSVYITRGHADPQFRILNDFPNKLHGSCKGQNEVNKTKILDSLFSR